MFQTHRNYALAICFRRLIKIQQETLGKIAISHPIPLVRI